VFVGSPAGALDALALGATGIVSSFDANVAPQLYAQLARAWERRDLEVVSQTFATLSNLFRSILTTGGLVVTKAILCRLGLDVGPPRPPRMAPDQRVESIAIELVERFALRA